jgi:hypothetical protein
MTVLFRICDILMCCRSVCPQKICASLRTLFFHSFSNSATHSHLYISVRYCISLYCSLREGFTFGSLLVHDVERETDPQRRRP